MEPDASEWEILSYVLLYSPQWQKFLSTIHLHKFVSASDANLTFVMQVQVDLLLWPHKQFPVVILFSNTRLKIPPLISFLSLSSTLMSTKA